MDTNYYRAFCVAHSEIRWKITKTSYLLGASEHYLLGNLGQRSKFAICIRFSASLSRPCTSVYNLLAPNCSFINYYFPAQQQKKRINIFSPEWSQMCVWFVHCFRRAYALIGRICLCINLVPSPNKNVSLVKHMKSIKNRATMYAFLPAICAISNFVQCAIANACTRTANITQLRAHKYLNPPDTGCCRL